MASGRRPPLYCHVTVGCGAPVKGISIAAALPARIVSVSLYLSSLGITGAAGIERWTDEILTDIII